MTKAIASQAVSAIAKAGPTGAGTRPEPTNETEIAALAYTYWMERGCPIGSPDVDWLRAEREMGIRGAQTANAA